MPYCLEALAAVAHSGNRLKRAARLFGAAQTLHKEIGSVTSTNGQAEYEQTRTGVRAVLGEEAYAAAWAEGQAMPLEEAVEYALEEDREE